MHFHQIINSCLYTHHADLWVSVDIMCAVSRLPVLADVAVSPWLPEREQQQQHTHTQPGGLVARGEAEAHGELVIDRSHAASWNISLIFSFHHHLLC